MYRYSIIEGEKLARKKFQTLTEQMFYTLLCFRKECCGVDIMKQTREITNDRVIIGPGTLYNLIGQFLDAELICETSLEGRRISYRITKKGEETLEEEYGRLKKQMDDFKRIACTEKETCK